MEPFDFMQRKPTQSVQYTGGAGETMEDAVIIAAPSALIGVSAEYEYIGTQCGQKDVDWEMEKQSLSYGQDGTPYDLLTVKLEDGTIREFYFNISLFYGKY
jgi:hypothetical protein